MKRYEIREATNGWILTHRRDDYVFETMSDLCHFLSNHEEDLDEVGRVRGAQSRHDERMEEARQAADVPF
jgi:hypothetical protein